MTSTRIPEDFPRGPERGAVAGAHPKLLVRKVGEVYVSDWTDEERAARYEVCADLVTQLIPYTYRKAEANPNWGRAGLEQRLAAGIRAKWNFSEAEINWMVRRATEAL